MVSKNDRGGDSAQRREPGVPPMSGKGRALALFLACVIVAACYTIFNEVSSGGGGAAEVSNDGGAAGEVQERGEPEKVVGDDGREYYKLDGLLEAAGGCSQVRAGLQLPDSDGLDARYHAREIGDGTRIQSDGSGIRPADGRYVSENSFYCEQSTFVPGCDSVHVVYDEPGYDGRSNSGILPGYGRDNGRRLLYGDDAYHGGAGNIARSYSLLDSQDYGNNLTLASAPGIVGRAWSKFVLSKIGQKLTTTMLAPVFVWCCNAAGVLVEDGSAAAEAAIVSRVSPAIVQVVNSTVQAGAPIASEDMALILGSRMAVMAETGAPITARTVAEAVTSDCAAFIAGGSTPAMEAVGASSGGPIAAAFFNNLAAGILAVDSVPAFSAFGESLIEWYNELNPDDPITLGNMDGFSGSGGGEFEGVTTGTLTIEGVELTWSTEQCDWDPAVVNQWLRSGKERTDLTVDDWKFARDPSSLATKGDYYIIAQTADLWITPGGEAFIRIPNSIYGQRETYKNATSFGWTKINGTNYTNQRINLLTDYDVYGGQYSGSVVKTGELHNGVYTPVEGESETLVDTGQSADNFFDEGGQLIGNDAQLGSDGTYDGEGGSRGTADIGNVVLNPENYNTWQDALDAGDVNPWKPSEDPDGTTQGDEEPSPTPDDPVYDPDSEHPPTLGDKIRGNPTTPTRLSGQLDYAMGDLGAKIGDKFPFSVPGNIALFWQKLQAEPEAPQLTWVFDVPTGREELTISLEDFSPVAAVLRTMLNGVLLFSCITLLTKIASLFELVTGE